MSICMRDTGFEFTYQGKKYLAQTGHIEELSIRGNIFTGEHNEDTVTSCHPER